MNYQMKCLSHAVTALFLIFGLISCSDIDVKTDSTGHNFDTYKSFAWYEDNFQPQNRREASLVPFLEQSIIDHLASKKYSYSEAAPDFYIAYTVTREEEIDVKQINTYSGVGQGFVWRNESGFENETYVTGKEIDIETIRKGSLIIDVIDAKSDLLVWRGSAGLCRGSG